jgi:guanylate kinase
MALFLIVAPSGAGKTSVAEKIAKAGVWTECISNTTRPMREGEIDGITYYFTNDEDFEDAITMGEFAEMVSYDGHKYGITHFEIKRVMNTGKHVYIIVEHGGYKQVKALYPDAVGIFLHMSKENCMANMLLRGDSIEKAMKRISTYDDEMKNRGEFDYVVKNMRGHMENTIYTIRYIIKQYEKVEK